MRIGPARREWDVTTHMTLVELTDYAYERAFADHWSDVFRFALAWTNDWGAAEDLAQDAFLRLADHPDSPDLATAGPALLVRDHPAPRDGPVPGDPTPPRRRGASGTRDARRRRHGPLARRPGGARPPLTPRTDGAGDDRHRGIDLRRRRDGPGTTAGAGGNLQFVLA